MQLFEQSIFAKNHLILDKMQEWLQNDFDPQLRSRIYFYFAMQGLLHPEKIMGELKSSDIQIQGAAIIA